MANRRMFAKTVIESDLFLDMPQSTQLLYFHLSMSADDDGFVNSPKKIQRLVGCRDDDLKILMSKKFIIPFDSGIVVIKHWKIHNYIRNDRYQETIHQEEKKMLNTDESNAYNLVGIPDVIPVVDPSSIGKDSIDNNICSPSENECDSSSEKSKSKYYKNTPHEVLKEDGTNDKSAISFVNFELLYSQYPKKVGKSKAFEHYVNLRLGVKKTSTGKVKLSNAEIYNAIIKYLEEKGDTEIKFLNQFDVFLNSKIYDYLEE